MTKPKEEKRLATLVQIDNHIAIPEMLPMGRAPRWPLRTMRVGDSFFSTERNARQSVNYAHRKGMGKFTTRTVIEDGVRGYRIWRIA